MRKAKKEKRTLGILAASGNDSNGPGEDPSIQINEDYARRDEAPPPPQRLEERREEGLQPPASEESSDVEDDDDKESSEQDDAIIASRRVDRRVFEAIRSGEDVVVDVYSSEDEADEEEEDLKQEKRKVTKEKPLIYLEDVNARNLLDEGTKATAQTGRGSKYDRIAYGGEQKKALEALLEAEKEVLGDDDDGDDLFQVKPKIGVGAGADRHKKLSKDLILGVQKQEGKQGDKSSKKLGSVEGPSSSEPDNDKPMDEQEETNVKRKSTRSGRRKRRDGDLKMSRKRKVAYGIIKPKRPKNH